MNEYTFDRTIFAQFIKNELIVIKKGLEQLDESKLSEEEIDYKNMCLGSIKYELKGRYQIE